MSFENSSNMSCPICGGFLVLLNRAHPGYQKPLTFSIYECKFCDSQVAFPLSGEEGIYDLIYENGDKIPGYARYFYVMANIKKQGQPLDYLAKFENKYWFVANYFLENDPERTFRILEIGSGLGYLTYALQSAGWDIKGIDISADAVRSAGKEFGPFYIHGDLIQHSQNNHETYDAVVMLEVVEHLTDVLSMMDAIYKLLKPNGVALITTPNKSFYPPGAYWKTGNPPVHFWWFSEKSMVFIAIRSGFYITFCDFTRFNLKDFPIVSKASRADNAPSPERGPTFDEDGKVIWFDSHIANLMAKESRIGQMNKNLKRYIFTLMQCVLPKSVYENLMVMNALRKSSPIGGNLCRSRSIGAVFHKLPSGTSE